MNLQALLNLLDTHYPNTGRDTIFIYRTEKENTLSIRDEEGMIEDEVEGRELVRYSQTDGSFTIPWDVYS